MTCEISYFFIHRHRRSDAFRKPTKILDRIFQEHALIIIGVRISDRRRRSDASPKPRSSLLLHNHLKIVAVPAATYYLLPQARLVTLNLTSALAENKEGQFLGVFLA
jgi:hypothetical protein